MALSTGSYTFKWAHPDASEVFVSGTFDDWTKSVRLEKRANIFEKTVELKADQKVLYKFVVDGAWVLDSTKPSETDENNIANNVLYPADIMSLTNLTISNIGPGASTLNMASQVPLEEPKSVVPGAFVETPAAEKDAFSVNPIPASAGFDNPITLEPGEKIPDQSQISPHTIHDTVKLDKETYDKPDSVPAANAAPNNQQAVPAHGGTIIPESGLLMGTGASPFFHSAGAESSTVEKAAKVPFEPPRLPEVVEKSQHLAHADPEASANPIAVLEKSQVEQELKSKIAEEPAALPTLTSSDNPTVPQVVKDSIQKSGQSPEAAANPAALADKHQLEAQLKKEVPVVNQSGEPAAIDSAMTIAKVPEPAPIPATTIAQVPEPTPIPAATTAIVPESAPMPEAAKREVVPETPKREEAVSAASSPATDKKSKRKSIFGKFKKMFKEKESPK